MCLRRIVTAPTPRMAAENSPDGPPRAANSAVFINGVDGILAARGLIAAMPAEELPQCDAIEQDKMDQEATHHAIVSGEGRSW